MLRLTDAPHGILLSTGAIPLLVGMLTTGDTNGRARAAMAIGSLAAGSEERAAAIARYSRESSGRSVGRRTRDRTDSRVKLGTAKQNRLDCFFSFRRRGRRDFTAEPTRPS